MKFLAGVKWYCGLHGCIYDSCPTASAPITHMRLLSVIATLNRLPKCIGIQHFEVRSVEFYLRSSALDSAKAHLRVPYPVPSFGIGWVFSAGCVPQAAILCPLCSFARPRVGPAQQLPSRIPNFRHSPRHLVWIIRQRSFCLRCVPVLADRHGQLALVFLAHACLGNRLYFCLRLRHQPMERPDLLSRRLWIVADVVTCLRGFHQFFGNFAERPRMADRVYRRIQPRCRPRKPVEFTASAHQLARSHDLDRHCLHDWGRSRTDDRSQCVTCISPTWLSDVERHTSVCPAGQARLWLVGHGRTIHGYRFRRPVCWQMNFVSPFGSHSVIASLGRTNRDSQLVALS